MKYELIAIDLDDTLLDSERNISEKTMKSVKKAIEAGVIICIATGRAYAGQTRYYKEMELTTPTICVGGAQILDKDANLIYATNIDSDTARNVLNYAKELGVHAHIYDTQHYYYDEDNYYGKRYGELAGVSGKIKPDLLKWEDLSTPKALCSGPAEDIPRFKEAFAKAFPELDFYISRPTFLEVVQPGITKATALEQLGRMLGVPREKIVAIGDSEIDYAMIKYAGMGVAMSNGIEKVKAVADLIVPDNDSDGVAYFIDNYVLGD